MRFVTLRLRSISTRLATYGPVASNYSIVSMSEVGIKYAELEGDLRREEG